MNVLELCLSHGVGGLELYALRTAKQLAQIGCNCLAVVKRGTMLEERMYAEGVRTITLQCLNPFLPLLTARCLAKIIDQEAVDVLHMHWGKDINLAVLAKCFAKRKVKLVYTRQMMLTRPKKDIYHRFLYRHIDIYLTITRQLRDKARTLLPMSERKIQLLYYGVEQPKSLSADQRQTVRQELGARNGSCLAIGLVGRIEAHKGQHHLIEALQILRKHRLTVHVIIIGPVMDKTYFSRIQAQVAQLELQGHVTFYGSHPNPIHIMPAFDIVVLTTEMETFGLVLIEAMRSGVAVVGSNAGGVPEIIEDGVSGLLFEPGNAADLAAKLKRYCKDSDLRSSVAAAGKARADKHFALEQHYERLKQIFEEKTENN